MTRSAPARPTGAPRLAVLLVLAFYLAVPTPAPAQDADPAFSIGDVQSAPFPSDLTAAPEGGSVAWVHNARGVRNVWVAGPPDYEGRQLTSYTEDDGQPIGDLTFTPDGRRVLFVRGGGPNASGVIANPTSDPRGRTRSLHVVSVDGGADGRAEPRQLAEGSDPVVSPAGDRVAFSKGGDIWFVGLEEGAEPEAAVQARGGAGQVTWSPDGRYLAFTSRRGDHSLIGLYDPQADTLDFKAPSVDRDAWPTWSPDGRRLAWIRTASEPLDLIFVPERTVAEPWSLHVFDLDGGVAREVWSADEGYGSAFRGVAGGRQLWWTADDRLVFPWEETGRVHLYSVPASGGEAVELTPGDGVVEHVAMTPDRRSMVYASNHGDVDRRHLWRVAADGESPPHQLTSGRGVEWSPAPLSGGDLALLASGARDPAHAEVMPAAGGGDGPGGGEDGATSNLEERRWMAPDALPDRFPREALVEPRQVVFSASDGMRIHGQLFLPPDVEPGEAANRPAVIFTHGGSRRQMLLGWHYIGYYHQAYGMNQWLAAKGYVVLSVNYRSGIGYGLEFREALDYGAAGASEFRDLTGAGTWLRGRPEVDGERIGLWGGSYGGYLTALGLARASDLFAAGVDLHGVHDWNVTIRNFVPDYDPAARPEFRDRAFEASPMADAHRWRSPVLFIHGDDDRNVPFTETVRMIAELRRHGKAHVEQLVLPDEVHGFLVHDHWLEVYRSSGDFFDRMLGE
jgi:dipeptidyl aminopeptidase/acylaminoacyl peptidase